MLTKSMEYAENIQKGQENRFLIAFCLLKICLFYKKCVSLHPIFVSCLIFKREKL